MVNRQEYITHLRARIAALEEALEKAAIDGMSSATISSGGASQSYTRYSVADMQRVITMLKRKLAAALTGNPTPYRRTAPDFRF